MNDKLSKKIKEIKISPHCLIASDEGLNEDEFLNSIADSFVKNTGMIVYCSALASDREFLKRAGKIKSLCAEFDVTFIIKSRTDIAFAAGADGVHLEDKDIDFKYAREILGENAIIGFNGISKEADYLLLSADTSMPDTYNLPVYIINNINSSHFYTAILHKQSYQ